MKQFCDRENEKNSGFLFKRENCTHSQEMVRRVSLDRNDTQIHNFTSQSSKRTHSPHELSSREIKSGKSVPLTIAPNYHNKTSSSHSCSKYTCSELNTIKKKDMYIHQKEKIQKNKCTSTSMLPQKSNYVNGANLRGSNQCSNKKNTPMTCVVKRLNGITEQINIKDIATILPNYIPYERKNNNTLLSSVFKTENDFENSHKNLGNISNLPVVYQNVELNLDLVKKCREASTSRKPSFSSQELQQPDKYVITRVNYCKRLIKRPHINMYMKECLHVSTCDINKPQVTPMLLKHSTNMILSKLKKMKCTGRTQSSTTVTNLTDNKFKKGTQFPQGDFSKNKIHGQSMVNRKVDETDIHRFNSSSLQSHDQAISKSFSKSSLMNERQDMVLQGALAKRTRVKSIEKKKCIEKVNSYKVVYESDDFVSIYKNRGEKTTNEKCIDVSSLLCIPGYVGRYLCESNSTLNYSHAQHNEYQQEKDKIQDGKKVNENLFKYDKHDENTTSVISPSPHEQHKHEQLCDGFENIFANDDMISYYLTKAVNCSPTLNLDLHYIMILNEITKRRESIRNTVRMGEVIHPNKNRIN
ncbi:hypothetical protein, conserved [Plasmodium gonderi]|uniref:Uncharacterized protein n=1 Tax=Plasmodium gonderi TaxID=77519 RepID=A0A1Y1JFA7_PLAGO|nr:hypothetical protein, conserved [Plasmodium gonderi]GAW81211.1 hypothetical protein, conserved [Plasmodium gonderi]